ncbi:MAG: potassium uptake protein [Erysipelotrichaceae bacterium]|nr:potassium uptake protein [Erysipelotrichaceae bacterium]
MNVVEVHKPKKKKQFSTVRRIALSFLIVIFIGSILLTLPISNKNNNVPYIDHLFVAVSATCVTALVPFCIVDQYSMIGQIIVLILIQIGGLGFLTLMNLTLVLLKRKLTYESKMLMQEALNQNSVSNIAGYMKQVIQYTLFFEITGAILLSIQFISEFGIVKSIYYGIFHSVSAFCNAGFDLLGSTSLINYQSNILVNIVIMGLIIAGGLGFVVWVDLTNCFKKHKKKIYQYLSLDSKIVLMMTGGLLMIGTIGFFALEYNNPDTIGNISIGYKLLTSLFQSTTLRTAGFCTVDMYSLRNPTKLLCSMLMFIGGSPAGTAGGMKTTTLMIMILYIRTLLLGHNHLTIMDRTISDQLAKKSLTIALISFFISLIGLFLLSISESCDFINIMFEVYSAFGTVGLSANVTSSLTYFGKIVVMLLMYTGRIGPLTMLLVFTQRYHQNKRKEMTYPSGEVLLG